MDLFSINCTTCKARLKVRDAAAIGQILGCPKCGSMVQVLPPAGWQPPIDPSQAPASEVAAIHAIGTTQSGRWNVGRKQAIAGGVTVVAAALLAAWLSGAFSGEPEASLQSTSPPEIAVAVRSDGPAVPAASATTENHTPKPVARAEVPTPTKSHAPLATSQSEEQDAKRQANATSASDSSAVTLGTSAGAETSGIEKAGPVLASLAQRPVARVELSPAVALFQLRRVDTAARLEDKFPAMSFQDTRFADVLDLISQLSTVPINLDYVALAEAGVDPAAKISLKLADASVRETLYGVLSQQGLGFRVVKDQVLVTWPAAAEEISLSRLSVADLAGNEPALAELAALIRRFVEPGAWRDSGGEASLQASAGGLVLESDRLLAREVRLFVDRLRLARNRSASLSASPGGLVSLESPREQARARLATPVSINFQRATQLAQVLRDLEKAADVRLPVDGLALADQSLSAEIEVQGVAQNEPLGEALEHLLRPIGMGLRILDRRTLLVTTETDLATWFEVQFYRAADLVSVRLSADELCRRIEESAAPDTWGVKRGGGDMAFDPQSGFLIVRQHQPALRQVETLLTEWRATKAKPD